MAKQAHHKHAHQQPKQGNGTDLATIYKVDQEKAAAATGKANARVTAIPEVNALCRAIDDGCTAYLKKKRDLHTLDAAALFDALPAEKQVAITAALNRVMAAIAPVGGSQVPEALEGGKSHPDYQFLAGFIVDPGRFKAVRDDGQPWPTGIVLGDSVGQDAQEEKRA